MNILAMVGIVLRVADAMVCKSALPDLALASEFRAHGVRVSALNELDRAFNGYVVRGSKQHMHVLRHDDECEQLKSPCAAVAVQSLEKQSYVRFHNEQPAPLPG